MRWRRRELNDLDQDIRDHIERETQENVERGMTPEEARRAALRAFGNVALVKEDTRAVWVPVWIDQLLQDARYAVRNLWRNPAFTLVVVLTLSIGIGANTAIFSVVNAVLLRPLPYPDANRLVRIVEQLPPQEVEPGRPAQRSSMNEDEFLWWRSESRTLSHIAAYLSTSMTYAGANGSVMLNGAEVSPELFDMLRVVPTIGRTLGEGDEHPNARVVVLSAPAWQRHFSGDPGIMNRRVLLDGEQYSVVGVMPAGFEFPAPLTDFWLPLAVQPFTGTRTTFFGILARLQDAVSVEVATAEANAIGTAMRGPSPSGASSGRFRVVSLQDELVAPVRPALRVLLVAVGIVLLIASANVANLLLARAAARSNETALRTALGASRGRLLRQLLTESLSLAICGAVGGIALAFGGIAIVRQLASTLQRPDLTGPEPLTTIPRVHELAIDGTVLWYALAVSLLTALIFSLAPATPLLRKNGRAMGDSGRGPARLALVASELALATILLVGAGLLIRSFVILANVPLGYDPSDVLTFQIPLPTERYPTARSKRAFAHDLLARLQPLAGVDASGYTDFLPTIRIWRGAPEFRAAPGPPEFDFGPDKLNLIRVSHDYLRTMGTRTIEGRQFGVDDGEGQQLVLVINDSLARRDFPGKAAIGQRVYFIGPTPWEIVGVVEDVRQFGVDQKAGPQVFTDFRQLERIRQIEMGAGYFVVRTSGDPLALVPHIRAVVAQIDNQVALSNVAPMEQIVANSITRPRLYTTLLGIFAGIATLIAAIGIYGVVAYAIARRTREIGIRIALGARRGQVLSLVLRQVVIAAVIGIVIGLGGATILTRYLETMLFGLTPVDPITFVAVSFLFLVVASAAALIPARHATKVDPMVALRHE